MLNVMKIFSRPLQYRFYLIIYSRDCRMRLIVSAQCSEWFLNIFNISVFIYRRRGKKMNKIPLCRDLNLVDGLNDNKNKYHDNTLNVV